MAPSGFFLEALVAKKAGIWVFAWAVLWAASCGCASSGPAAVGQSAVGGLNVAAPGTIDTDLTAGRDAISMDWSTAKWAIFALGTVAAGGIVYRVLDRYWDRSTVVERTERKAKRVRNCNSTGPL